MARPAADTADPTNTKDNIRARLEGRTEDAFAEEERQGLMLAARTRTIALAVVLAWQVVDNPLTGPAYAYDLGVLTVFAVLGIVQYLSAKHRLYMASLKYAFVLLDCTLLALFFTAENPFTDFERPAAFPMHGSNFVFYFLFLMQAAFSLRPRLVLWCGACIVIARTGMLLWVTSQPGVITNLDLPELTPEAFVDALGNPNFVYLGDWLIEILTALIVAGGLAVVVARSRRLVENRSLVERARANLARYFSPNVVDRLSHSRDTLGAVREQNVAVLFADIMGFTKLCEKEAANDVIHLLRDYHVRLGKAVFANGGTLDKYLGDGLMATFGTPDPSQDDARNALKCALDMIAALEIWNAERRASGGKPVRVGIGLHYGPVIAGDIGNERRLEYSVIGDAVNIASRLEHMTRNLDTPLVVSDSLVKAVARNDDDGRSLMRNLLEGGVQDIRGRDSGVVVWTFKTTGSP